MKNKTIAVDLLKLNPANPREITPDKFEALKKSIKGFPKMMELRPMIVDAHNIVLGGNMRLRAIKELGMKNIPMSWVKRADKLTKSEKRRFLAVDNLEFGAWTDDFANDFDLEELLEWGFSESDLQIALTNQPSTDAPADESSETGIICCPKCGYKFTISDKAE